MKILKKVLPFIVIITLVFQQLMITSFTSYATVSSEYKVTRHSISIPSPLFDFKGTGNYYLLSNTSGLTPCSLTYPNYFFTNDHVTFDLVDGRKLISNIANLGLGLVFKPSVLTELTSAFFNTIKQNWNVATIGNRDYIQDGLYDLSGNFYGYCLNDISGCYYTYSNLDSNVQIPSSYVNNVYNFLTYDNFNSSRYLQPVAYVDIECPTYSEYIQNYVSNVFDDSYTEIFNNNAGKTFFTSVYRTNDNDSHFIVGGNFMYANYNGEVIGLEDYDNYEHYVRNFSIYYGLIGSKHSINWRDILDYKERPFYQDFESNINTHASIMYQPAYFSSDRNGVIEIDSFRNYSFYNDGSYTTFDVNTISEFRLGFSNIVTVNGSQYERFLFPVMPDGNNVFRIYDSSSLNLSNYNSFNTDSFNDFDSNNNNSYNTSTQQIDNSVTNNSVIYNNISDNWQGYVSNGSIDYAGLNNQIIRDSNNSYGQAPNNSENNNGGSGGSSGSGDSNDDSVLDKFLELLLKLFEAVGKIFSTVLTGVIDLFTMIIDTLADLMSDITPFTQFLGTLFGFLPAPIPQVIATGFSICILCAVISFIRGK